MWCDTSGCSAISAFFVCPRLSGLFEEIEIFTILIVILILMLLGAIPTWPHSRNWGYAPSGGLGLVVTILIILLLLGRI